MAKPLQTVVVLRMVYSSALAEPGVASSRMMETGQSEIRMVDSGQEANEGEVDTYRPC